MERTCRCTDDGMRSGCTAMLIYRYIAPTLPSPPPPRAMQMTLWQRRALPSCKPRWLTTPGRWWARRLPPWMASASTSGIGRQTWET